jgi:hypothetical protein
MTTRRCQTLFLLILLLGLDLIAAGQQGVSRKPTARAISYGFVSPNTREDLKLEEAIRNLDSGDEDRLVNNARTVACRVRVIAEVRRSVGNWADGAENSTVFRALADESTIRYATVTLGSNWKQKSVLYFQLRRQGKARLYLITIRAGQRDLKLVIERLARTLDQAGIPYRTFVPTNGRVLIYVVDLSNELRARVRTAAHLLHARPSAYIGSGAFIGDDNDRDRAQQVFSAEIKKYESQHSLNKHCKSH